MTAKQKKNTSHV